MNAKLSLTYYTDILCVWALISQARVHEVEEQFADIITTQWNSIKSLFGDEGYDTFYHSTVDQDKYIQDQLVAALSGFLIYQSSIDGISADALDKADSVMELLLNY